MEERCSGDEGESMNVSCYIRLNYSKRRRSERLPPISAEAELSRVLSSSAEVSMRGSHGDHLDY